MSYDFVFRRKKGQTVNLEQFKNEINNLILLNREELVFCEPIDLEPFRYHYSDIKYDKEVKKIYYDYLSKKGVNVSYFNRIFNIIDENYATQFIKDNPLEYDDVNVLLICTKGKTDEELLEILKLLKDLAVKYDLILCNPQSKEYVVDLTKDNSELTL